MDINKNIPKVVNLDKRKPLRRGQTEGKIHVANKVIKDNLTDDALKATQPKEEKSRELSLSDMKMWLVTGITKDDKYVYQIDESMSINDLLGLRSFLNMKVDSDISVHQKMNIGLVKNSIDYLVKVQESYNEITATRLTELKQSLESQTVSLQTFVNAIQESSIKAQSKSTQKKTSKKKIHKKR